VKIRIKIFRCSHLLNDPFNARVNYIILGTFINENLAHAQLSEEKDQIVLYNVGIVINNMFYVYFDRIE